MNELSLYILDLTQNSVAAGADRIEISICYDPEGDRLTIVIQDNGCGIDPKYMDTLFSGYYAREDEPADSQKKNAGIGLSVCATIIKAHGGNIKAENAKSGGAIFRFALDTEAITNEAE